MIRAVLDACVLYSASLRDFMLRLAGAKVYHPRWSEEIQNEWTRNLLRNRPDLTREKLERTCREMDLHFPNGLVSGHDAIISTLTLPDLNDRHVLAAAIHAQAKYIVTFDLSDFPKTTLRHYGIEALSPDEFVLRLIQKRSDRVLQAVKDHRSGLSRPPKTVSEYLATLEKQGLIKTVAFFREHQNDL